MYNPKELYDLKIENLPDYLDSCDVTILLEEILSDVLQKINLQFSDRTFIDKTKIKITEKKLKNKSDGI